jgi:hypothetical protein
MTVPLLLLDIFPALNNKYPMTMFNIAQSTFMVGDERPLPGGLEKGVGKGTLVTPWTKCGTAFAKNIPAKKQAM